MFQSVQTLVQGAVLERVTLLINHVLAAEPVAMTRLQRHSGSAVLIGFKGWPSLLPALPVVAFRISPAGLVEWLGETPPSAPDLRIEVDVANPAAVLAQALTGERPNVEIAGDAEFASDVNWLIDNLRWDIEDDLARFIGAAPAAEVSRLARAVADGLRAAVRTVRGATAHRSVVPTGSEGPPPR
jgi:ubiquinone biosynthesis protein UbiJ